MVLEFIPFSKPDIGEAEIRAVVEVLKSGWITTGRKAAEFEGRFSSFLGDSTHAVAVNSATAGLHLALESIGIGPGDEVIVPSLTFTATAEVVRYLGATPVLVDVDRETLNISPDCFKSAISERTRAVLPVHYGGLPCEMTRILGIASQCGINVVEDAAHALPAVHQGRHVGSLPSAATVFSFYANKTMTTGEGGMVVTRNPDLAKRMRMMRLHGIDRDAFHRFTSKVPAWYYEVLAPGFKYNLTDIAAAIGLVQMERLPSFHLRRKFLANRYYTELSDLPLILPHKGLEGDEHAWHLYVIRLNDDATQSGLNRDSLIEHLSRDGIGTSVHYVPLHRQPYWRQSLSVDQSNFPVAEAAYQTMISIPLYTAMTDGEQDRVIRSIRSFFA